MVKTSLMVRGKCLAFRNASNAVCVGFSPFRASVVSGVTNDRVVASVCGSIMNASGFVHVLFDRSYKVNVSLCVVIRNFGAFLNLSDFKRTCLNFAVGCLALRITSACRVVICWSSNACSNSYRMRNGEESRAACASGGRFNLLGPLLSFFSRFERGGLAIVSFRFIYYWFRGGRLYVVCATPFLWGCKWGLSC